MLSSSTKENARPREEEAGRINGDEKRQRFEDNGDAAAAGAGTGAEADGEEGDRFQLLNVITFACRPLRHCVGSFPTVSISLKQGPGVVSRLVRHLFDSKLEALTGERDESHLWCIRDDECRRTLLSNDSRPAGGAWFDDEESRESQDANQQTLDLDHLEKGDSMHLSYDEHSHRPIFYKFTVDSIAPLVNPDEELPRCTVPASRREFTQAEKQESESYRRRREELARSGRLVCFSRNLYLQGKGDGMTDLPLEGWRMHELESMECLIKAEVGFKAAWKDFLQHAFLSRSEAAASKKYYETKKTLTPVSPTSNAQKDILRARAFKVLLACREDVLTRMSIATLEASSANAWAEYRKWDEIYKLINKRDNELTEEQRKRKSELFNKYC